MGKLKLPTTDYPKNISAFRKFTNVIAGTGAVFALLHVFIGYMNFDPKPNASTGDVPKFFDEEGYLYYLVLAGFFALSVIVAGLLHRLPALALVPSAATTTYLLLLLDADYLVEGKMTFILFSLFVLAGNTVGTLYANGEFHREFFRFTVCAMALFAVGWAITVFFRAPAASEQIFGMVEPIESLDGRAAVERYERLKALSEIAKAEDAMHYLRVSLVGLLSAVATLFLPHLKVLVRTLAVLLLGYTCVLFSFSELTYFPMLFVVPILFYCVGCLLYTPFEAPPAEETPADEEDPDGTEPPSGSPSGAEPETPTDPASEENGTV